MKKRGDISEAGYNRISVGILILMIIFVSVFVWLHQNTTIKEAQFDNEKIMSLTDEFQVTCGTKSYMTQLPAEFDGHAGEKITLIAPIEWAGEDKNALLFYARQSEVSVYLNDELVMESDKNRKLPMKLPPSSRWYLMRLPETFYSGELRIEITPYFDEYAKELPEIYLGSKSAFLYMVLRQASFTLAIGIPLIFLGLVMLILGLFLKDPKTATRIRRLAILTLALTVWIMSDAQISQVFWWNLVDSHYILFATFFLIPALLTAFLLTFRTIAEHKYMHVLFWESLGMYVMVQFLQITGLTYYVKLVPIVFLEVIAIYTGVYCCYLSARKSEHKTEDSPIYKALLVLGLFALVDGMGYYINPAKENGSLTMVGVAFFLVYLGYSALHQMIELQKHKAVEEVYRELAFIDVMTGLSNRTAFERQQEVFRQREVNDSLIFMMMDLNELKKINDEYGHAMGDDAIVTTAKIIEECFGRNCKCFRIGGDEFCVIAENVSEAVFKERLKIFEMDLDRIGKNKSYPYSVAAAYAVMEENDFDECMRQADRLMYQKKAEMKNNNQHVEEEK